MARPWRIQFPGAVYHVMSRGNNFQDVFLDVRDRQDFLDLLGRACDRFHLHPFAFCLMTNHFHLFLRTAEANLAVAMKWLNATYTVRANHRQHRVGHLFQGRYRAVLVANEAHWLHLSIYLHLNPVRAKLVKDPVEYEWSSYRDCIQPQPRFDWLRRAEILAEYGPSEAIGRRRYRQESLRLAGQQPSFWEALHQGMAQSSREALKALRKKHPPRGRLRSVPEFTRAAKSNKDLNAELSAVAAAFKVAVADLLRRRRNFLPRAAAYYHLVENCGLPVGVVAAALGVGDSAVSMGIRKFQTVLQNDHRVAEQLLLLIEN